MLPLTSTILDPVPEKNAFSVVYLVQHWMLSLPSLHSSLLPTTFLPSYRLSQHRPSTHYSLHLKITMFIPHIQGYAVGGLQSIEKVKVLNSSWASALNFPVSSLSLLMSLSPLVPQDPSNFLFFSCVDQQFPGDPERKNMLATWQASYSYWHFLFLAFQLGTFNFNLSQLLFFLTYWYF